MQFKEVNSSNGRRKFSTRGLFINMMKESEVFGPDQEMTSTINGVKMACYTPMQLRNTEHGGNYNPVFD